MKTFEVLCLIAIALIALLAIGLITSCIVSLITDPPFYRHNRRPESPWWDDKG